jgi:hypothetical protein
MLHVGWVVVRVTTDRFLFPFVILSDSTVFPLPSPPLPRPYGTTRQRSLAGL